MLLLLLLLPSQTICIGRATKVVSFSFLVRKKSKQKKKKRPKKKSRGLAPCAYRRGTRFDTRSQPHTHTHTHLQLSNYREGSVFREQKKRKSKRKQRPTKKKTRLERRKITNGIDRKFGRSDDRFFISFYLLFFVVESFASPVVGGSFLRRPNRETE